LRLRIYPDGGIARLRVYGQPDTASALQTVAEPIDLVAMENGGRPIAWNDAHFGHPSNLLLPGRGSNMGKAGKPGGGANRATTGAFWHWAYLA
jgi:allantoicase